MSSEKIRVYLVDDQAMIRAAFKSFLSQRDAFEVVDQPLEGVLERIVRRLAASVSPGVVRHDTKPITERAGLDPEVSRAAAETVREHDGGSRSLRFDVKPHAHSRPGIVSRPVIAGQGLTAGESSF